MLHDRELIWPAPTFLGWFLFGAYLFGGFPAFTAGLFVAGLERSSFWRVSRIGIVVGLVVGVFLAIPQLRFLSSDGALAVWLTILKLFVLVVVVCLVPTIVCWLVARPWTEPKSDMSLTSD
jgi:hypothetical protein